MPAELRISWISSASVMSPGDGELDHARHFGPDDTDSGAGCNRAALDERREPALGERDLDHVEVAGDDRLREHLARLARGLGPEVAGREVRQREQLHARGGGDLRRLARGRVRRLSRPLALLLAERRLVDEQLGALREVEIGERRRGVAGDRAPSVPARGSPSTCVGRDDGAVGERDRLAATAGGRARGPAARRARRRSRRRSGPGLASSTSA